MKKRANIFFLSLVFTMLQNCDDEQFESSLNYVVFGDTVYSTAVDIDGRTTLEVAVYTSKKVSSDISFDIIVDESSNVAAGSYNVPSSVIIPDGTNEGTYVLGKSTDVKYIQNCNEALITLDIVFDGYG